MLVSMCGAVVADAPIGATDISQQHAGVYFVAAAVLLDISPVFATRLGCIATGCMQLLHPQCKHH
jgi:hypothetical protein